MNRNPFSHQVVRGKSIQPVREVATVRKEKYLREKSGDFKDSRLRDKIGSTAAQTLLLLPPEVSGIRPIEIGPHEVRLHEMRGLERGRENHRNEIHFGQLFIGDVGEPPVSELVAIKYTHPAHAVREMFANLELRRRLRSPATFSPLGFVTRTDGKVGLITRYEHDVNTLDNILWNPKAPTNLRMGAFAFAGAWMAHLHNHGVTHGDAQAKNIAYTSQSRYHYPDLEGAEELSHGTLAPEVKRLVDVSNLFDPETNPIEANLDEVLSFVDAYDTTQKERMQPRLDPLDIEDVIDQAQNTRYNH